MIKIYDYKTRLRLKSIDISCQFANSIEHGVIYKSSDWTLFEPTKFIYAFFAFNMLYEIDWKLSIKRQKMMDSRSSSLTKEKIKLLLKFIYSGNPEKSFLQYYLEYDENLEVIQNSNQIKVRLSKNSDMLNNYKSSLNKLNNGSFTEDDHYNLLIFCYKIRNNIFHGSKTASSMIKGGQRERLLNYANILMATMDMFFSLFVDDENYSRSSQQELIENLQIRN